MTALHAWSSFAQQLDAPGLLVVFALLAMSVITWYVIAIKTLRLCATQRRTQQVVARFWDAANLNDAADSLRRDFRHEPAARLATDAIAAMRHHRRLQRDARRVGDQTAPVDLVTRTLRRTIARETARLESGLTVLASIGGTAPFVGLFGTVWGIYHALRGIAAGGISTLEKVAGPVGEALIMTAAGIAVAIPAVLAYNALLQLNRLVVAELDGFAHDLLTHLTTGSRVDPIGEAADQSLELQAAGARP